MTQQNRTRLMVILVLAVPTIIFIGSIFYNAFHLPPPPPFPKSNGYDDLIHGATMLDTNVGMYSTTNLADLQKIVKADAEALQVARAGLQKECRVPLDYNPAGTANTVRLAEMKFLGIAFNAEGDLATLQGHPELAARSYLDIIHLANESSRGGTLIDELVGVAISRRGTDALQHLLPQLDAQTCRETAAALETLDAQQPSWNDAMWYERYWAQRAYPGIDYQLWRIVRFASLRRAYQTAEKRFEDQQTRTRKLAIDFAVRSYELDKGHPPATVEDLVTNYLQTIPVSLFTGTNMVP